MTEKSWMPLTEAFNIVGKHVYGDAWTGEEVDYDPIRAALPPAEKMPLWGKIRGYRSDAPSSTAVEQPTAVDLVAMMVERHKKTFKVLISLFHDGNVPTELEIDGSDRKPIRQEAWPDPEAWRWPDEDDPDLDEFDRPGRFDQYRIFWFSIPAGVGLFKPADGRDSSVLGRQYSDGALWHQFIDDEPKTVFVDCRSLEVHLAKIDRDKPSRDIEDWERRQHALRYPKDATKPVMTYRAAAGRIAEAEGVDVAYVERETRRVRQKREAGSKK